MYILIKMEYNIAVVGEVDSAKSTLIGVISQGVLDDGNGRARLSVLSLKHEIESGKTSNVNTIMTKLCDQHVRLLDLAGHERYLHTTMSGLTVYSPKYAILAVAANRGVTPMAREHFRVCYSLRIPIVIVVTKIDICPADVLRRTMESLKSLVRETKTRIHLYDIRNDDSLRRAVDGFNMSPFVVMPLFKLSCVTGDGLDMLQSFMGHVSFELEDSGLDEFMNRSCIKQIFTVYKPYSVPGIGNVVFGQNVGGTIRTGDKMYIGPIRGSFHEVRVRSMHDAMSQNISEMKRGQSGCLAIRFVEHAFAKRICKKDFKNVVLCDVVPSNLTHTLRARVAIFSHSTTIQVGFGPYIHCGHIGVAARVVSVQSHDGASIECMSTGDRGILEFNLKHPQLIIPGTPLIFREGRARGVGSSL